MRSLLTCAALTVTLLACSDGAAPEEVRAAAPDAPRAAAHVREAPAPRVVALRALIEAGDVELASALYTQIAPTLDPVEMHTLAARISALSGGYSEWVKLLETAIEENPDDPRPYATAAELAAAHGQNETAKTYLARGLEACGTSPVLERAIGVRLILLPGGAEEGLGHLEKARRLDPDLPFVSRPLSQAHLLLAKARYEKEDVAGALEHAKEALRLDRGDIEVRRFLADVLLAAARFDLAIEILDELVAEGVPVTADLASAHKRAGLLAMLDGEREEMLEHFLAARANGMPDEELGTGATQLEQESERLVREGLEASAAGDDALAEAKLARAVELDPGSLHARHYLANVLFEKRDFDGASREWRRVVDRARELEVELPEPVHVFLAKALFRAGHPTAARLALQEYLDREPFGEFIEVTREELARLPE